MGLSQEGLLGGFRCGGDTSIILRKFYRRKHGPGGVSHFGGRVVDNREGGAQVVKRGGGKTHLGESERSKWKGRKVPTGGGKGVI